MADDQPFDLGALLGQARRADATGARLSGNRLERVLGRGAMGEAWLATREADGRTVVVKLLDPIALADPATRARARREWSTLRKVRPSRHVVAVLDLDLDHERPHLVLEFVPGEPLDRLARRAGRLPWADAARVVRDLALGLDAVHEQGVVHRDVKPANAIVRPDGAVTLVDFGLAKDLYTTNVTGQDTVVGTAAYMAPEQWDDATTRDGRGDLFSLGVILYELASGAAPFEGGVSDVREAAASADYRPLEEAAPGVPRELALVVDLLLSPDPAWRHPRAELVARDLDAVARGGPSSAPAFEDGRGGRWPLVRGRRWMLGSASDCAVVVPQASPRHAQVRREAAGFSIVDAQGSAGTRVEGAPLVAARPLAHGERVELGGTTLRFVDPLRGGGSCVAATEVVDARRVVVPAPIIQALAAEADPRAVAWLIERLAPDPAAARLDALLDGEAARLCASARAADDARAAPWALERLGAATGQRAAPPEWLAWWVRSRGACGPQAGPGGPRPALLRVAGAAVALDLGARGVALVGRDPRCDLAPPQGPRLAATLARLHRRWVARDEVTGAAALLDPGRPYALSGASLLLEVPPPVAGASLVLDATAFFALAAAGHRGTLPGLVLVLGLRPALEAALAGTSDVVAARARAVWAEGARLAHERLAAAVGRDLGAEPAAWRDALRGLPGPALQAEGWGA